MGFVVYFHDLIYGDMGVPLGCGKLRMAEQLLNASQVGPTVQHMGGEGMPDPVEGEILEKARLNLMFLHDLE